MATQDNNANSGTQWFTLDELQSQGYEVMGVITKDSTDEDIHEVAAKMARKSMPADDNPVWTELALEAARQTDDQTYVFIHSQPEELDQFEAELAKHLANGGNEAEYWKRIRNEHEAEWETKWAQIVADEKSAWEARHVQS